MAGPSGAAVTLLIDACKPRLGAPPPSLVAALQEQGPYSRIPLRGETQERKELREAMRKKIAEEKKQKEECSDAPQAAATAALEDGHDDEVTTSGDGGTNAAVGDDTLETERSDSQPSQAGPYLTGSAQKY